MYSSQFEVKYKKDKNAYKTWRNTANIMLLSSRYGEVYFCRKQ